MRTMLLLAAALCESALAEVYKWVDKDGVTHYSDRPQPGSEKIVVAPAQGYEAPKAPATSGVVSTPTPATTALPAQSGSNCPLLSPLDGETLQNVPFLTFTFANIDNARPVLTLNDKRYTPQGTMNFIKVEPAVRGSYEAKLQFLNASGAVVCAAPRITFHVRQPSVLNPKRPRPR
jgi:hypothetical protein